MVRNEPHRHCWHLMRNASGSSDPVAYGCCWGGCCDVLIPAAGRLVEEKSHGLINECFPGTVHTEVRRPG